MVSVLDRKVWRDLLSLRGQALTIVILLASGTTILIGSVGTYFSLLAAQQAYYQSSRFADVWAETGRAPRSLLGRLSELPGVGEIEPRIVKDVRIDWPASDLSIAGRIISIPMRADPTQNRLTILRGSGIDPLRRDEVLVNAAFAESWKIDPGDNIRVILNGRIQVFRIAGIAQSPEYVFAARAGNPLPDDRTFVVMWAGEDSVAAAFDMEGAFNSLAITLAPGASERGLIADLDRLLEPYGGRGAYGRSEQPSHRFLTDELVEQQTLSVAAPVIFFGIASFLLNVVIGRLVQAQREQIASLKALGFPTLPIALHYLKFVGVICIIGASAGVALGVIYTTSMMEAYRPFFRFPEMRAQIPYWTPAVGIVLSAIAAASGALSAVYKVVRLKPAEGMRPATPHGAMWKIGSGLSGLRKMALRSLLGRPLRTIISIASLSLAVPLLVLGLFWWDALAYMIETQFERIERSDAIVAFTDPRHPRAVAELASVAGVLASEGQRIVPVRLSAGYRTHRLSLTGLAATAELRAPRARDLTPVAVPANGVLLTADLAKRLGVTPGSALTVETLEGQRRNFNVEVSGLVDEVLGYNAYIDIDVLHRYMREDAMVSHVALRVDPAHATEVWRKISERPRVAAVSVKSVWLRIFDEKIAGIILIAAIMLTSFGFMIAIGVIYNAARVSLQERAWELASLRILGFTRGEVTSVLLTELAVHSIVAIPLGLLAAKGLVTLLLDLRDNESFSIPPVISPATFGIAALIVIMAVLATALLIRRKVDRLDLVAVLKARD